ncbi:MAG: MBL fold metallo-hydrolase [Anaerolineae bacterium]|nr:MBL fold metallo-hydrolase [Anaerolineae bacterium]
MNIHQIAPDVYVATVYPGINVGLILTEAGPIAVDAPLLQADIEAWRAFTQEVAGRPILYTILTDHRPERVFGARAVGAPTIAGAGTLAYLEQLGDEFAQAEIATWREACPEGTGWLADWRPAKPELTVDGQITLHGSPSIVVESIAGAGPGSVWVRLIGTRVLFTGDAVTIGMHPFLQDAPDTRGWLEALVYIRRPYFPFDVIVPGRGSVSDKEATRPLSEYIQLARRRMRSFHIKRQDLSEVEALLPEFLDLFPVAEGQRDAVRRRVKAGLEQVYRELYSVEE